MHVCVCVRVGGWEGKGGGSWKEADGEGRRATVCRPMCMYTCVSVCFVFFVCIYICVCVCVCVCVCSSNPAELNFPDRYENLTHTEGGSETHNAVKAHAVGTHLWSFVHVMYNANPARKRVRRNNMLWPHTCCGHTCRPLCLLSQVHMCRACLKYVCHVCVSVMQA